MENPDNWKLYPDGTAWFYNGFYHISFYKVDKIEVHHIYKRHIPGTDSYQYVKFLFCNDFRENPIENKITHVTHVTICKSYGNIEGIGKILWIKGQEIWYEPCKRSYCQLCFGASMQHKCQCQDK